MNQNQEEYIDKVKAEVAALGFDPNKVDINTVILFKKFDEVHMKMAEDTLAVSKYLNDSIVRLPCQSHSADIEIMKKDMVEMKEDMVEMKEWFKHFKINISSNNLFIRIFGFFFPKKVNVKYAIIN